MSDVSFERIEVKAAADFIACAESALILCHVNPDGDTLGSALALKRLFTLQGKSAKVAVPSALPEYLEFLADGEDVSFKKGDDDAFDKIIAVDVASPRQLGPLAVLIPKVGIMIDHHVSGEPFAPCLIEPDASAAGEIVFKIYKELASRGTVDRDADLARYLFAAISSDTGSFKFSNTTPATFRIAAELTEEINSSGGPTTSDLSRLLHDTSTELEMKISVFTVNNMELYCGGALAVCFVSAADIAELGASEKDFSGAIDVVRSLKGVEVALTVRQKPDGSGTYKISARSSVDVDVAALCREFGGGGHVRAAGATASFASPEEAKKVIVERFSRAVEEYARR